MRGQLLDVKRYSDGTFTAQMLFHVEPPEPLSLANAERAQQFVSWWYAPQSAREQERVTPEHIFA